MLSNVDKIARGASKRWFGWQTAYDYHQQIWIGRFRFHRFLRGDPGDAHHNHPWPFYTFPLTSYVEDVLDPVTMTTYQQVVHRFRFHYRAASHTHRVLGAWSGTGFKVRKGSIFTLVWRGKHEGEWFYWRVGKRLHYFPWRRYLETIERTGPLR